MDYKYLTPEIKEKLVASAEKLEIDSDELESFKHYNAISPLSYYGPEPAYDDYDEDEYFAKQLTKLAEYCQADGFWEYIDFPYDEDNEDKMEKLNVECVDYLEELAYQVY